MSQTQRRRCVCRSEFGVVCVCRCVFVWIQFSLSGGNCLIDILREQRRSSRNNSISFNSRTSLPPHSIGVQIRQKRSKRLPAAEQQHRPSRPSADSGLPSWHCNRVKVSVTRHSDLNTKVGVNELFGAKCRFFKKYLTPHFYHFDPPLLGQSNKRNGLSPPRGRA